MVRGGTRLAEGIVLLADGAVSDLRTFDPGTIATPLVDNWVDIRRGTSGVSLENQAGRFSGASRLFFNFGRHEIHDGFHSRDHTVGLQLHQAIALSGGSTITVGADLKRFGGEAENRTRGVDWGSHSIDERGVFAVLHQPLPAGIVVTGGVRVNHHELYGVESAPQLGVAVPLMAGTMLRAASGRGFRSPTIRELYLFPAPNPELEPERAWSNEVSLLQRLGGAGTLELAVFRMDGSNLIRTTGSFPNLVLANAGEFSHRGAEAALRLVPVRSLELDLAYGYLDSGEMTLAHPEHQLNVGARLSRGMFTGNLGAQHVVGLYGADGSPVRLPAYTVVRARVAAHHRGVTAYLAGENLLDAEYQVVSGYPMPGRVLSVGAEVRAR
jgi:outer membrane cobalamin receptor